MEGIVQRDRDHYNVMVVVQESLKTEQMVTLEDSEGKFLRCDPVYRDTPPQRTRVAEDTELVEGLCQQLTDAEQVIASAASKDRENAQTIWEEELTMAHQEEVAELKQHLETEKERARKSWGTNCEHLAEQDAIITAHDEELTALRKQIRELQARASREKVSATREDRTSRPSVRLSSIEPASRENRPQSADRSPRDTCGEYSVPTHDPMRSDVDPTAIPLLRDPTVVHRPGERPSSSSRLVSDPHPEDPADGRRRQEKAPLIEFFSGEDLSILLDDWLPSLERAATWNGWTTEDKLMQLPGYLRGRPLQEWSLLPRSEQQSYPAAIEALRTRLDPGSKTVAAQDFRHSLQKSGESVSAFIRRLEKKYQIAEMT